MNLPLPIYRILPFFGVWIAANIYNVHHFQNHQKERVNKKNKWNVSKSMSRNNNQHLCTQTNKQTNIGMILVSFLVCMLLLPFSECYYQHIYFFLLFSLVRTPVDITLSMIHTCVDQYPFSFLSNDIFLPFGGILLEEEENKESHTHTSTIFFVGTISNKSKDRREIVWRYTFIIIKKYI